MTKTTVGRYWHITTLVVAAVALVLQLAVIISGQNVLEGAATPVSDLERVRRFFCYFTIQSNFLVAVAMGLIVTRRTDSQPFRVIRLASLIGITVTGIIAAVALPPSPSYSTLNLLCDRLLHIVVPALTFVGWLIFGPRGKVRRNDLFPSLIWPVLWLVSTLALGPVVNWYPYPFIDVNQIGYGRTLINCAVIAVLFLALAAVARWVDERLPAPAPDRDTISS
ncbi:MAG: Pr6Pr family membrane protein [Humibacillus sp.]|nr:Pr6Pr family membrane protein [Humibacillus sp.]MDN5778214.1 Pr6Pr family membrane protein [Humibacillus sp.]